MDVFSQPTGPVIFLVRCMDELSRSWYQRECQQRLREQQGKAFEDFFATIMELAHPRDFQRSRPYGNQGDLKCDGYLSSQQIVFQVYAPRTTKLADLLKKIRTDFAGALKDWEARMRTWVFVHNDHEGLPAKALQLIHDLAEKTGSVRTESWGPSDIQCLVLGLSPENLARLLGPAPTLPSLDGLRFDRLRPILLNIKRQAPPPQADIRPVSPEKLYANAFSTPVLDLLRMGRRKEALVSALLSGWSDPTFGEEIAEGFRRRYAELKESALTADEIFGELQAFAGGSDVARDPAHQAAVLAVLSYFFERCDIFEDRAEDTQP